MARPSKLTPDVQKAIIAAHNLNRRCYAMEISPNYGAVILERFQTVTGITPELID